MANRTVAELFPGIKASDQLKNEAWSSDQNSATGNRNYDGNANGRSVSSHIRKDLSLSMIKSGVPKASFKTELLY